MDNLLVPRNRHLFGPGPKRILTLDGGGVRGALTIAFLERLERLLSARAGHAVRLCDQFDLIGGTSTGAIIATALALGHSAAELKDFYFRLGPRVFRASRFRVPGWTAKFDARALREELDIIVGSRRLDSEEILTGLGVVLKRLDTGGSWIVINNPKSKYWHTPTDRSFIGNAELSLAKLVRASTAAPTYFDPETIEISEGRPPGLFLDGGVTPHNNPALAFFLASVLPPVGLDWTTGPEALSILSIGTGGFRPTLSIEKARQSRAIGLALKALAAQIAENQRLVLTLMTWLGTTTTSWPIDGEIGDLGSMTPPFGSLFKFNRLDVTLEQPWLAEHLGITATADEVSRWRAMDNPRTIPILYELGRRAAEIQLTPERIASWDLEENERSATDAASDHPRPR